MWTASFSLPLDDAKNAQCKPLNFVEITDDRTGEYIGLFRIIPTKTRKLTTLNEVNYELEHVLATLLNDVLFKYHQRSNLTTEENIEYILSRQSTKHWRLGVCSITRYFHYKWENENGLLGPLFSIAEPFDVPYEWTFDTRTYPWTLNLLTPSVTPSAEIRFGKNLAEIERNVDPSNIVNRLYALGYGEGVNQLTIEKVNGLPYIENENSIAEYGLGQYVWVDRRFEDAASLLASAKAFLEEWSVPRVSYRIKAVDLSSLTGLPVDKFTVGKVVRVHDPEISTFTARIVSESKSDIYGAPGDIDLEISNTKANVGTSLADIERRQEINEVYSQGATNIDSRDFADNCDASFPAVMRFYIPEDVVNINEMTLTYETTNYRAYSKTIEGGGAIVSSTASGGSSSQTSSSGGGVAKSTASGGGSSQTSSSGGGTTQSSSAGGDHSHLMFAPIGTGSLVGSNRMFSAAGGNIEVKTDSSGGLTTYGSSGNHSHSTTIPHHSHSVSIPSHSHDFDIPNHVHTVNIPAHTHDITLPDHTHEIKHGIFEYNTLPTAVQITVDGNALPITATSGERINLIPYLSKDSGGNIARGRYAEIKLAPNNLARINANVSSRLFIQSRIGTVV